MKAFLTFTLLLLSACGSGGTPAPVAPRPIQLAASPPATFWPGPCEVVLVNYADVAVLSYTPMGLVDVGWHEVTVAFADGTVATGRLFFGAPVVTVWVIP